MIHVSSSRRGDAGNLSPLFRRKVDFTGGYATGAGLYDGRKNVPVEAHPDAGYEVNYFMEGRLINLRNTIMHNPGLQSSMLT